jgi:hypothetical protein
MGSNESGTGVGESFVAINPFVFPGRSHGAGSLHWTSGAPKKWNQLIISKIGNIEQK